MNYITQYEWRHRARRLQPDTEPVLNQGGIHIDCFYTAELK